MDKINNISLSEIDKAIALLQKAGLDTNGVIKSLSNLLIEMETNEPKVCKHNWVLDGHNCGEAICSNCYKRPEEVK